MLAVFFEQHHFLRTAIVTQIPQPLYFSMAKQIYHTLGDVHCSSKAVSWSFDEAMEK